MNQLMKKMWNGFTTLLVALMVILAILLVGVRLVGLQVFTVLSGSMEPSYPVGALLYVKEVDPFTLQSGDVITFLIEEDTVATHRIVEPVYDREDPAVLRFRTKGDANEAEDGTLVHYRNVIGTPVFSIPQLGRFASYIQNPPGSYVAVSGGALLMLLLFLPEALGMLRETESEAKEKQKRPKKEKPPRMIKEAAKGTDHAVRNSCRGERFTGPEAEPKRKSTAVRRLEHKPGKRKKRRPAKYMGKHRRETPQGARYMEHV